MVIQIVLKEKKETPNLFVIYQPNISHQIHSLAIAGVIY